MDLCEIDKSSTELAVSDSSQEVKYNIKKKITRKMLFFTHILAKQIFLNISL